MPTQRFLVANAVLVVAALLLARVGWRRPVLSLVIPSATLVNAVFFHILPTIAQEPGVARPLHRCASLRALFVMGLGRRRARWCGANGDCDCYGRWYLDDGKRCLGSKMAQRKLWRIGRDNAEGFRSSIPAAKPHCRQQRPKKSSFRLS